MIARTSSGSLYSALILAGAVALPALVACDKKDQAQGETKNAPATSASVAASAQTAPSAPVAPSASSAAAATQGKMAHCPNIVTGANTVIKDVEGGVAIAVTAKEAASTSEIRTRAKFLAESAKNMSPDVKHTGGGEGGGTFGRCPVVMRNTSVDLKEVEGGAELTVKPKDAKELDWLRREARERLAEIGDPNAKEAGQGKMAHCPSAIANTKTSVKELKDGVEVTVLAEGKSEAVVKDIRERAKLVLAAAKLEATKLTHKGDGSGGGGFGRCPVVLKETKVESKDVEGGVAFTVKPEKAEGLAELKKETKERAEKFAIAATDVAAAGGKAKTDEKVKPTAKPAEPPKTK